MVAADISSSMEAAAQGRGEYRARTHRKILILAALTAASLLSFLSIWLGARPAMGSIKWYWHWSILPPFPIRYGP